MADLYNRLSKDDAAVLLVGHQTGLVAGPALDQTPDQFKNNVRALTDIAKYFKLPVIVSTGFEDGPNGPTLPDWRNDVEGFGTLLSSNIS